MFALSILSQAKERKRKGACSQWPFWHQFNLFLPQQIFAFWISFFAQNYISFASFFEIQRFVNHMIFCFVSCFCDGVLFRLVHRAVQCLDLFTIAPVKMFWLNLHPKHTPSPHSNSTVWTFFWRQHWERCYKKSFLCCDTDLL